MLKNWAYQTCFFLTVLIVFSLMLAGCNNYPPRPTPKPTSAVNETPRLTTPPTAMVTTTPTLIPKDATTPTPGNGINSTNNKTSLILTLTFIVAFFASIPIIVDIYLAHGKLKAMIGKLSPDDLAKYLSSGKTLQLPIIGGLARSTMALTITLIVGISVFILIKEKFDNQIIGNVLTALTTALTSITAYYFGAKTSEKLQKGKKQNEEPPIVKTGKAENPTANSVTLTGIVNANGVATTVLFEYDTNRGSYTYSSLTQNVSGTSNTDIKIGVSGLSPGKTYYYRIKAQSIAGTVYGSEDSFETKQA